jgi:DNA primase catalytic core
LVAKYWHKVLLESQAGAKARSYLKERGMSAEVIEDFQIGYAIESWTNLFDFLIKKGFRPNEISSAGFCIKRDRGDGYYDRFRDRIMFPICDHNGRVCGFSGRTLNPEEPAKYVNSPQTEIYDKSSIVFALNNAKAEIKKQSFAVVVEGQMDAISAHQFGFKNTVASSGTALTTRQIQLLKRFSENIYLALDNDSAGQNAILRGEELISEINQSVVNGINRFGKVVEFMDPSLSSNINLKIVSIPIGKDPDECLKTDPQAWLKAINEALPVMDYIWLMLSKDKNLLDPKVKKEIADAFITKIVRLDNPIEKDYWLKELANRLNIGEPSVRELAQTIKISPIKITDNKSQVSNFEESLNPELRAFRLILAIIWVRPKALPKVVEILMPEMLGDNLAKSIYKALILFYTKNNQLFLPTAEENEENNIFNQFYSGIKDSVAEPRVLSFLDQSYLLAEKDFFDLSEREIKIELDNLIKIIKNNYFVSEIEKLKKELDKLSQEGNQEKINSIIIKISDLIKQKAVI